jgi:hypothetical protein
MRDKLVTDRERRRGASTVAGKMKTLTHIIGGIVPCACHRLAYYSSTPPTYDEDEKRMATEFLRQLLALRVIIGG